MPFIRYTRDKRGYEHTYVMHAYRAGQSGGRTRLLYLFRSPANLKVGRKAFESEVTEALEHTHPDLSFDWTSIPQEPDVARGEARERDQDRHRDRDRDRGRRSDRASVDRPPASPSRSASGDLSVLAKTLGPQHAARLRGRYRQFIDRITRRAETPEERDRLLDLARRLNPEDWMDEAAVRAAVVSVEAGWDAIAAELPSRRRGRRGGRRRSEPPVPSGAERSGGIIEGADDHANIGHDTPAEAPAGDPAVAAGSESRRTEPAAGADTAGAADDTGWTETDDPGAGAAEAGGDIPRGE